MNKFKTIYGIIIMLLLVLVITKGINVGIDGNYYYPSEGMVDGFSGHFTFLIYNIIIAAISFIVSLIITVIKRNDTEGKIWFFIAIIILILLVPTSINHYSGGIAGINEERYTNILMIPVWNK